jgi:hypothetical protein
VTRTDNMGIRYFVRPAIAVLMAFTLLVSGFGAAKVAAAQAFSVIASPGIPGVATSYTLNVTLDGYIGLNTLVSLQFDPDDQTGTSMFVPSSIDANMITVYSGNTPSPVTNLTVGIGRQLQFRTTVTANNVQSVTITINQNAGLKPLTVGIHTVSITVGQTLTAYYDVQPSSSSSAPVTVSSITAGDPHLGVASSYKVLFSLTSTLLPSADTIYVKFPTAFSMPNTMDGSNFGLIQGARVVMTFAGNATIDGSTIALRIPPTSPQTGSYYQFDASGPLELRCGPYTGIRNPTQGGSYTFEVWTSRQMTHATYQFTLGTGVTSFQASIDPAVSGANAEYRFSFATSQVGALSTSSTISVTFPAGFVIPATLPAGTVQVSGISTSSSVLGQTITIRCPGPVSAGQAVQVSISRQAGIRNATSTSGTGSFSLVTSSDALVVLSAPVTLSASTVQPATITLTPAVKNSAVDVAVRIVVGAGGALQPGDTISMVFPIGFSLPGTISSGAPSVRVPADGATSIPVSAVSVSSASRTISVALPGGTAVPANGSILILLPAAVGIRTPQIGGEYSLMISTARETTPVASSSFTVFANPVSTLVLAPQAPDGKGGAYLTQPSFTLSVNGPAGVTLSAFYRVDDAGAFLPYDIKAGSSIKVPEGRHSVSYYSQDSLGNIEPTHSQQLLVDLTDPIITVSSPVQGSVVVQASTSIIGKVQALDVSAMTLTVNGLSTPVAADGSFSAVVSFKHEGVNPVDIVASSLSGRAKTLTLSVNYIARVTMSLVIGSSTVNLNNEFKTLEAAPFISKKGVTMVPLRFISEAFKADVAWDPVFKSVTLTLGGKIMRIQVGFLTADVSGKSVALQDAPVIVNGRTFVPLRFIAENFGAKVDWNAALKMVSIVYPKP